MQSGIGGKTVLLVDDSPENLRTGSLLLQQAGYYCLTAANGYEALQLMRSTQLDLVLMDCQMPVMDGWSATKAFREIEPPGHHLTIIAVTAASSDEDRENCITAGMDGYLQKPFRASELYKTVARFTEKNNPEGTPEQTKTYVQVVAGANFGSSWRDAEEFSPQVLKDLWEKTHDVDPNLVQDLAASFIEDFPAILNQLRQANANKDGAQVADIAHKMQSRCGRLGARRLHLLFRDMEVLAKGDALPDYTEHLATAGHQYNLIVQHLRELSVT